ncbi:AAA family ATPase [Halorientalis litorea]|uniref:AAA family ATPase n=1 Tax=Halorientalis litorea TaxID=2931977 RepID=UPI001FF572FA|nr:AAA family ATPase [Halorientalis litorea]
MSYRTRAVVTVADAERPVGLAPDVSSSIGASAGDAVRVLDGTGGSTVRRAEIEPSLEPGTARLGVGLADQLEAGSGNVVLIESATPVAARAVELAPVPALSLAGGEAAVRQAIGQRPISPGDELKVSFFEGSISAPLRVTETRPSGLVVVDENTQLDLSDGPAPAASGRRVQPVAGELVGGYDETIRELNLAVVGPLVDRERADALDGTARAGVLLVGPSGVGKTHLLGHAVWRANATVHSVDARTFSPQDPDAVRDRLREAGAAVSGPGPGIVHVDGLDDFLADSDDSPGATCFREWLRQYAKESSTVVVGEAREFDDLPPSFLRGELLARTVRVDRPTDDDRGDILSVLMRNTPVDPSVDVDAIGRSAFGYVAADLLSLRSRAVETAIDRSDEQQPVVSETDFRTALEETEPQQMAGTRQQVPSTSFDDIGGLETAKRELRRAVEWPIRFSASFERLGIDPVGGVLLYGPPGTGKTTLARAVASTTEANFISVSGPELMNKYVGESERAVRLVFEQARASAPTVVFFDEVDSLGSARSTDGDGSAPERVVSQLLTEMDGIRGNDDVTVIGATNRPDKLDDALLRPGRFDRLVEVPVPDETERAEIFRVHTRDRPVENPDCEALAARTEGYTGSDIAAVVREAGLLALEEHVENSSGSDRDREALLLRRHFERALEVVEPSLSAGDRTYDGSLER